MIKNKKMHIIRYIINKRVYHYIKIISNKNTQTLLVNEFQILMKQIFKTLLKINNKKEINLKKAI